MTAAERPAEGWGSPNASRKWHYFRGTRSLCGRYGMNDGKLYPDNDTPGPDDCKTCRTRLAAGQGEQR